MELMNEKVKKLREKYGSNEIKVNKKNSFIKLFIESLGDLMIKILLIILGIKLVFLFADTDWFETLGIFIAIFNIVFNISLIKNYVICALTLAITLIIVLVMMAYKNRLLRFHSQKTPQLTFYGIHS
jgi:magnesium-transporting ATPase (P-type)